MPDVSVQVLRFGGNPPRFEVVSEAATDRQGRFAFEGLDQRNVLLSVAAGGFYSEVVPVYLHGAEDHVRLSPLALVERRERRFRLWLAGDTMFGRRFEDLDEDGNAGEAQDLIRPATRAQDARSLFARLLPALASADYRVLNLESPVSTAHESRHPLKQYSFTSHPESASALKGIGIDAVSLGNNHSYDYLEPGRKETEQFLRSQDLSFFGSGASEAEARESFVETRLHGVDVRFQGFNGIKPSTFYPDPNEPWEERYLYYAKDEPRKGGALLLSRDNLEDFLLRPGADVSVPVMHGGAEYGEYPSNPLRDNFAAALRAGAPLVVAHHSHTVFGVALWGEEESPRVALMSMGNLLFDQEVFETFNSYMAVVDLEVDPAGETDFVQLRLIGFHQEDYVPSLISGPQLDRLARHVGHLSTHLPYREGDELRPAIAFRDAAGVGVMLRPEDYVVQRSESSQRAQFGSAALLRLGEGRGPAAFFESFSSEDPELRLQLGREKLIYGDFEDCDIDERVGESRSFSQSDSRYATSQSPHHGSLAFSLYRPAGARSVITTRVRNRVRFDRRLPLTLSCAVAADHAGSVEFRVRYRAESDGRDLDEEVAWSSAGGSHAYQQWSSDLHPPSAAGFLELSAQMEPPVDGRSGLLLLDDCALIEWGPTVRSGAAVAVPHAYTWARITGAADREAAWVERYVEFSRRTTTGE